MLFIQYLVLVILAGIITYLYINRKELNIPEIVVWVIVTAIIAIIAVFPYRFSETVSNLTGIGRGIDALFVISLIGFFAMMLKLYVKVYDLENQITEMNREMSIRLKEMNDKMDEVKDEDDF